MLSCQSLVVHLFSNMVTKKAFLQIIHPLACVENIKIEIYFCVSPDQSGKLSAPSPKSEDGSIRIYHNLKQGHSDLTNVKGVVPMKDDFEILQKKDGVVLRFF